jgi:outer membrane protein assembly factor BamB
MKLIKRLEIGDGFAYPCYPLLEQDDLYIGIRYTDAGADIYGTPACTKLQIQKQKFKSNEVLWTHDLDDNDIVCKPVLHKEHLIAATENGILAIDRNTGKMVWKVKLKNAHSHLSVVQDLLYVVHGNSVTRINPETGKSELAKKYRVKWLDSAVAASGDRLFVSTSNSKIVELQKDTLEITQEYKFQGSWAVASTPDFFEEQMLSSTYGAHITSFDMDSGEVLWRVKKQAGREPKQLLDERQEMLFCCEILGDPSMTAIKLPKGKKLWTKDYHVQAISDFNDDELAAIMRNKEGQYFIGLIHKNNGDITAEYFLSKFVFDDRFNYRLWNGAALLKHENRLVVTYSPNEIFICE